MKIKELFSEGKSKMTVLILASIGIFLIIGSTFLGRDIKEETEAYTDLGFYTSYLEERICELCNSIYGVSDSRVFLTLDCSSEQIYQNDGMSDFLILSGKDGEAAVKLCEIYPRVRGVAVVCTGGDIPRIQETITELLSAALGLPKNKIRVAGG